jgi:hypothetical protein
MVFLEHVIMPAPTVVVSAGTLLLSTLSAMLVGCATSRSEHAETPRASAPASDATTAALLGRVKALAGTWEKQDPDGNLATTQFTVTSAGSVVREIMFPGSPHEMTNMYRMDGDELVVTHFCAVGNQPTMEAELDDPHQHPANELHFHLDEVDNYTTAQGSYMGELALKFVSPTEFHQIWTSTENGKLGEPRLFVWTTQSGGGRRGRQGDNGCAPRSSRSVREV